MNGPSAPFGSPRPTDPAAALKELFAQAQRNLTTGNFPAAERAYRTILQHAPGHVLSVHYLGMALVSQNQFPEGAEYLQKSIQMAPREPRFQQNWALALVRMNRIGDAIAAARAAVQLDPTFVDAFLNLGNLLVEVEKYDEAVGAFTRVVELKPDFAEAYCNLGRALWELKRLDEAEAALLKTLELRPNFYGAYANLGNIRMERDDLDGAEQALRRALEIQGEYPEALANLGMVEYCRDRPAEAMAYIERALAVDPRYVNAHKSRGLLLLWLGDYRQGWAEAEWRWQTRSKWMLMRSTPQPLWDGSPLNGRRLMITYEQGFGDMIEFCRYGRVLAKQGKRVMIEAPKPLVRLFRTLGVEDIITAGTPLPPYDVYCPPLTLPAVMHTDIDTVPNEPFLRADPADVPAWRERFSAPGRTAKGLRVGLAWGANDKTRSRERSRAMPIAYLNPLLDTPGVTFYSLQVGEKYVADAAALAGKVHDLAPLLKDFADTAAAISQLDLVISVDTSVVHVAGAMHRPVWVLLPKVCDWRWMRGRSDSPWYPSARLFRQTVPGDWSTAVEQARAALIERARAGGSDEERMRGLRP